MAEWSGSSDLRSKVVPLASLTLLPGNPRQGDVGAVSESLLRFGQMKPIVVDSAGVILAGNHTFLAAQALGWDEIAVTVGSLEGEDKTALALADNRLSDLASYDDSLLLAMLSDLSDLSGTGYELDDVEEVRLRAEEPLALSGDERFTPAWVFEGMGVELDIDLAAPPEGASLVPASRWFSLEDDALSHDWRGLFAWCNPPFSQASVFGRKWNDEVSDGVWLGPNSHGSEYVLELMASSARVVFPLEIQFGYASRFEGIGFPVFLAGRGRGGDALGKLIASYPRSGVLLSPVSTWSPRQHASS